jgi:hypothetical protein
MNGREALILLKLKTRRESLPKEWQKQKKVCKVINNIELPTLPGAKLLRKNTKRNNEAMDKERNKNHAYDYLCHIGEAKEYIYLT